MKDRVQIALPDTNHCTGCQACRIACPVEAITMQENERGHIYPIIDEEKCIKCNKCAKTCPELNPLELYPKQDKAHAMFIKDVEKRKFSTSGGLSYILSKNIIDNGGYFCGAIYNIEGVKHQVTCNLEDLSKFQGSKYAHSDVKDVYKEIKSLLIKEKTVLFTGVPCQVAGLRTYLQKEYDNLYTIDILCHGAPSRKHLKERIAFMQDKYKKTVTDIRFRDKQPDQYHTCMKYTFDDGSKVSIPVSYDEYFRCFVTNHSLRPNCFSCRYSKCERVGDITLADFWLYRPKSLKFRSYKSGTSLVLINSKKGEKLIDDIDKYITKDVREINEAIRGNHNLKAPQPQPQTYDAFWKENLSGKSIIELCDKYYPKEEPISKETFTQKVKLLVKLLLSTIGIYKI